MLYFTENKEMVYSNASKYYLVYSPPPILTLHLKRFEQVFNILKDISVLQQFNKKKLVELT